MNKLVDIRIEKEFRSTFRADFNPTHDKNSFYEGFDTAIGLELHIKFLDWAASNGCWRNGSEGAKWYSISIKLGEDKTTKELFDYWLENYYKI